MQKDFNNVIRTTETFRFCNANAIDTKADSPAAWQLKLNRISMLHPCILPEWDSSGKEN